MTDKTNKHSYKGTFTVTAAILTAWFGYSNLVCAETDYSLSTLNKNMAAEMNKIKQIGAEAEKSREECANGNDNACI